MSDREQELKDEIYRIGEKHRAAYLKEIEPLERELVGIVNCKVPRPFIVDGELIQYIGRVDRNK